MLKRSMSIDRELNRDDEYEEIDERIADRVGEVDYEVIGRAFAALRQGLAESGYAADLFKTFGPNTLIEISLTAESVLDEPSTFLTCKVPAAVNREMTAGMPARRFRPTVKRAARDLRRAVRDLKKSSTALFSSLMREAWRAFQWRVIRRRKKVKVSWSEEL